MFSSADFLTHSTNLPERCRSFMEQVTSTQLFENFIFEKLVNSNQSDFLFFDESIIAKQNRSQFQRTKVETPFLSDTADEVSYQLLVWYISNLFYLGSERPRLLFSPAMARRLLKYIRLRRQIIGVSLMMKELSTFTLASQSYRWNYSAAIDNQNSGCKFLNERPMFYPPISHRVQTSPKNLR